jgi:TDG/mug DNA glycosylase family protein
VEVLPAIVGPEPVIVFCGMAGAESTKTRDHYYASPGNSFWQSLHLSGLSPEQLRPDEDHRVVELGLGLTDLVGHWDHETNRGWVEIDLLVANVERWQPAFLAFTAKGTAAYAAKALGHRRPGLGLADWGIGKAEVFVLPGTSGANQRKDYDGRPNRLSWWRDLASLAGPELGVDTPVRHRPDQL